MLFLDSATKWFRVRCLGYIFPMCRYPLGGRVFSCLTGGTFSALFSLIVTRMQFIHQLLSETLYDVKATNPLTLEIGHKAKIRSEILTDLGVSQSATLIAATFSPVINACNAQEAHGGAANYLYSALKSSAFTSAIQSLFLPKYPHA